MGILIAPVAVGLIYAVGGIVALLTFQHHRALVPAHAVIPGAMGAGSSVTVDYSGLHRAADGARGTRGYAGVHRA